MMTTSTELTQNDKSVETSEDYSMIDTLNINNFKCFKSVDLTDCRRINLVVGRNGSGKSALLEALYLAATSNPLSALDLRAYRGVNWFPKGQERFTYEEIWMDLFHQFDQDVSPLIRFDGQHMFYRSLKITYAEAEYLSVPFKDGSGGIEKERFSIVFVYQDQEGKEYDIWVERNRNQLDVKGPNPPNLPVIFFPSDVPYNQQQFATYFSNLSKQKQDNKVTELVRQEFPFIEDLSIEALSGIPALFASVSGVSQKIPVTFLSSGITKLLCVLLGIASHRKGLILIDEIENGFYHDRLESIWRMILDFAREYKAQVFASTHSYECLQAASALAKWAPESFSLIRATTANQGAELEQFGGAVFHSAIEQDAEVR